MPTKAKKQSRAQRWADAAGRAEQALEELSEMQGEFQDWLDNLPENLQGSTLGDKLQSVCDLDLDGAKSTVEEANAADLPLGFGRD